jgi:hypothetical protein
MVVGAWLWIAACFGHTLVVALVVAVVVRWTLPEPHPRKQLWSSHDADWAVRAWSDLVRKKRHLAFKRRCWSFLGVHLRTIKQRTA